jgi:hypothetical protein
MRVQGNLAGGTGLDEIQSVELDDLRGLAVWIECNGKHRLLVAEGALSGWTPSIPEGTE